MLKEKKYTIGGGVYIQRPVVLGQLAQLIQVIPDRAGITGISGPNDVIAFLGDALVEAISVVLLPEGTLPADKDLSAIQVHLMDSMDLPTTMEVIKDFFDFNQVSSLVEDARILMTAMESPGLPTGSRSGSVSSPTETSPGGS